MTTEELLQSHINDLQARLQRSQREVDRWRGMAKASQEAAERAIRELDAARSVFGLEDLDPAAQTELVRVATHLKETSPAKVETICPAGAGPQPPFGG